MYSMNHKYPYFQCIIIRLSIVFRKSKFQRIINKPLLVQWKILIYKRKICLLSNTMFRLLQQMLNDKKLTIFTHNPYYLQKLRNNQQTQNNGPKKCNFWCDSKPYSRKTKSSPLILLCNSIIVQLSQYRIHSLHLDAQILSFLLHGRKQCILTLPFFQFSSNILIISKLIYKIKIINFTKFKLLNMKIIIFQLNFRIQKQLKKIFQQKLYHPYYYQSSSYLQLIILPQIGQSFPTYPILCQLPILVRMITRILKTASQHLDLVTLLQHVLTRPDQCHKLFLYTPYMLEITVSIHKHRAQQRKSKVDLVKFLLSSMKKGKLYSTNHKKNITFKYINEKSQNIVTNARQQFQQFISFILFDNKQVSSYNHQNNQTKKRFLNFSEKPQKIPTQIGWLQKVQVFH
ncbi:unnamed protein product (macronuclear) [Paramecium tetraurelia]|uniref:Transmembrane protein n=1 Tax=Paramecium tetraurelia TaxID=5888 RepID=A0E3J7_PARTE|nr:uncharacterized protein GSPATT00023037001 [Paramecium tetraurelia]CAK89864.1 unnamed protein product [Paramecium tetraurelia]|eukprot:XP_001457261.1 hypothetical protein (macronuclear) [Paramecium tetraurelia strain d4-2]